MYHLDGEEKTSKIKVEIKPKSSPSNGNTAADNMEDIKNLVKTLRLDPANVSLLWLSLWPSDIGAHLEWNRLRVRFTGSVGYISHVHRAYDYSGPFGGSLGAYGLIQKLC